MRIHVKRRVLRQRPLWRSPCNASKEEFSPITHAMKNSFKVCLIIATAIGLGSCGMNYAVTGNYNLNTTQVQLATNNFKVVDNLTGTSSVSYVLMIGGMSKEQLYANAYADMMKKADMKSGARAVTNVVTEEQISGFLPFYYVRTITVSANVIEFTR